MRHIVFLGIPPLQFKIVDEWTGLIKPRLIPEKGTIKKFIIALTIHNLNKLLFYHYFITLTESIQLIIY